MVTLRKTAVWGSTLALTLGMAGAALASDAAPRGPKASLHINAEGKVQMNAAEVTAIGASSLSVKVWGTTWTVNVTDDTKIVRRHGGASGLSEFAVGDRVSVRGSIVEGSLAVNAKIIRNQSTREVAFRGTIESITAPDTFVVKTGDGVMKTVKVTSATKIMVGEETKTFADLAVGMKVGVKGFVNANSTVITARVVRAQAL